MIFLGEAIATPGKNRKNRELSGLPTRALQALIRRGLRPEHAHPAIVMRAGALLGDQRLDGGAVGLPLEPASLGVEPADCGQFLCLAELCLVTAAFITAIVRS